MKAITPAAIKAHGFEDFVTVTAPIFDDADGKQRKALVRRFHSIDAAIAWLRVAPRPIYIMEPHPDVVRESSKWVDYRLRYAVGEVSK